MLLSMLIWNAYVTAFIGLKISPLNVIPFRRDTNSESDYDSFYESIMLQGNELQIWTKIILIYFLEISNYMSCRWEFRFIECKWDNHLSILDKSKSMKPIGKSAIGYPAGTSLRQNLNKTSSLQKMGPHK